MVGLGWTLKAGTVITADGEEVKVIVVVLISGVVKTNRTRSTYEKPIRR
jgi:hypothetical protein